jgi:hypothetical protein
VRVDRATRVTLRLIHHDGSALVGGTRHCVSDSWQITSTASHLH